MFMIFMYDILIVKNFMIDVKFYNFLFILGNFYIVLVCILISVYIVLDIGFK